MYGYPYSLNDAMGYQHVRMSTVVGFVGDGGIGFLLQQWICLLMYEEAGAVVWAIAIVVAALDYATKGAYFELLFY